RNTCSFERRLLDHQRLPALTSTEKKRTSKSSEEDSAYAGFGSTSPASSTQSSMSLQSTSSKNPRKIPGKADFLELLSSSLTHTFALFWAISVT
ncbi:hypothetical protein ANCDUO_21845, partial [Ancylostoma duodenale]